MEMEEGGGGGESVRDGRGVIQRCKKAEGERGLKGAIQRETLVKNRGGVKKRETVFEGCLRRRATATEPR